MRTSTTVPISEAVSKSINSPIGRVEWPTVKNGNCMLAAVLSNLRRCIPLGDGQEHSNIYFTTNGFCAARADVPIASGEVGKPLLSLLSGTGKS